MDDSAAVLFRTARFLHSIRSSKDKLTPSGISWGNDPPPPSPATHHLRVVLLYKELQKGFPSCDSLREVKPYKPWNDVLGRSLRLVTNGHGEGGNPSVLDANSPPPLTVGRRPLGGGGGGALEAGFREGRMGGGAGGGLREGPLGGGVQVGQFGVVVGGGGSRWGDLGCWGRGGGAQAPLTSLCPPSNHTITINVTLTFAAS